MRIGLRGYGWVAKVGPREAGSVEATAQESVGRWDPNASTLAAKSDGSQEKLLSGEPVCICRNFRIAKTFASRHNGSMRLSGFEVCPNFLANHYRGVDSSTLRTQTGVQ
jgi:hypothetical protein